MRVLLAGCVLCLTAAAAAVADAPVTSVVPAPVADAYEFNDSQATATPIEPGTRYVAAIAGPQDADWFTIRPTVPAWGRIFASDHKEVDVSAARLGDGCAARSLRITLFDGAGAEVTSAPVYPGAEASILSLRGDPHGRYDLRIDSGLDPSCDKMIRYAFGAYPYTPSVGASQAFYKDTATCDVYRKKVRKISQKLKRTRASHKQQRRQLKKDLATFRRKVRQVC